MSSHAFRWVLVACVFSGVLPGVTHAARELDKALGWPGETLRGYPCYGKRQGFGPFDYANKRNWVRERLGIVEGAHFPPESENLTGTGKVIKSTDLEWAIGGDFDYTLRAFPNHHRALFAWVRLYLQNRNDFSDRERAAREQRRMPWPPPECYLQRARAFAPEDPIPLMIFGVYLHRSERLKEALQKYQEAETKIPNHPELVYNLGLLFYDLGDYDAAENYAAKAHGLGYPLKGLQRKVREKSPK